MVDGICSAASSAELSYDDFVETYGRIRSNSVSSTKQESIEDDNNSTSTDSFSTIVETSQIECDGLGQIGDNAAEEENRDLRRGKPDEAEEIFSEDMDKLSECLTETRRRSSTFSTMASRLARKSFRIVAKKASRDSDQEKPRSRSRSRTSTKWNKLFKRSQSKSRSPNGSKDASFRSLADGDHLPCMASDLTSSSCGHPVRPAFGRSVSHSPTMMSKIDPPVSIFKRRSLDASNSEPHEIKTPMKREHLQLNLNPTSSQNRKVLERPTFLPISPDTPEPKPCTPEYDVMRKYEDIRHEDELRMVAIVTLLNRRKNSLKIKCDQFNKDLSDQNVGDKEADTVRSRLKHMNRKLNIVQQCIDEQNEVMKVNSAKLNLQHSLELYQLNLIREDRNGYTVCKHSGKKENKSLTKTRSSPASCYDLLQSVNENYTCDDSSSVTSSEQKESGCVSPLSSYGRRSSSACGSTVQSSNALKNKLTSSDESVGDSIETGPTRSVDYAVTSDCDSGFDNGDALSRSDFSLDRSFSKSTGSITSSSSRGTTPGSASTHDSASPGDHCEHEYFFSPSNSLSEQPLYNGKVKAQKKLSNSCQNKIDDSVLAPIEDFEKFAARTKRRLSNNGRLVPLKKGD